MNTFDDVPVIDDVVVGRLMTLRDQVARPGEDVLLELLALFERDTATRIAVIRDAVQRGDAEERKSAGHALKGSAGNIGARRVAVIAAHVEKNPITAADVDRLAEEVRLALAALRTRLR